MKNVSQTSAPYLLEISIEDLHWESRDWLAEIASWQEEVAFYQKLLDKLAARLKSREAKQLAAHYQTILREHLTHILLAYQKDIETHEQYLYNLVLNKEPFSDQFYREVHKKYSHQVRTFAVDLKQLKKELFFFLEKVI